MKSQQLLAGAALALCSVASMAQFVKGNEAVQSTGPSKQVELPPIAKAGSASKLAPCAADGRCHAGAWYMVETTDGLKECTEPFARPTSCRASSFGTNRISRLWVVKTKGHWRLCQRPDLASKCVKMFAPFPSNLPYSAVQ